MHAGGESHPQNLEIKAFGIDYKDVRANHCMFGEQSWQCDTRYPQLMNSTRFYPVANQVLSVEACYLATKAVRVDRRIKRHVAVCWTDRRILKSETWDALVVPDKLFKGTRLWFDEDTD